MFLVVQFCLAASAMSSDSLQPQATSFSNSKTVDKQIAKQLKLISKATGVKAIAKNDGLNTIEWISQTECYLKRQIEYTDACGVGTTNIKLLYVTKRTLSTDSAAIKLGPAAIFIVNEQKMQLQKIAFYQPTCQGGKVIPNSYNLKWFDTKGQLIELP